MNKINAIAVACLMAAVLAGCSKTKTEQPVAPLFNPPAQLPMATEAQPKLPTMKIYLGDQVMDTEMALTAREESTGMMFRTNIPEDDSMLFDLYVPQAASFWMTNCPVSESAAYISPDGIIEEIHHFEKNDPTPVVATNNNILFVLETADGWFDRHNIKVGTVIRGEKGSLRDSIPQR
ncbi:MAG TPA: DUF192 domain-containing protein [Verrucomicrobiae bacterium]